MIRSSRKPRSKWAARLAAQEAAKRHKKLAIRIGVYAVLGLVVCVTTGTWIDDFSKRRPGLWKMVTESGSVWKPVREVRICIDAASEAALFRLTQGRNEGDCIVKKTDRRGERLITETVCRVGDTEITARAVLTIKGDVAYRSEINAHFDPPTRSGRTDATSVQDARWIGACPDDMEPGDIVMPSGVRVTLNALLGLSR